MKKHLNLLLQSILFWFSAFFLFFVIRFSGLKNALEIKDPTYKFTLMSKFEYALIIGIFFGVIYSFVEFLFERFLSKRLNILLQLLIKTVIYFITIIILSTLIRWSFQYENNIEIEQMEGDWWHESISFWVTILFFLLASLNFSFIKIAIEKFGKNNFIKMLLGTYKKPKEEERIFMFLDLKDSTSIAEKLGHFQYSAFIQECFYDLNEIVPKHDAEIYQYIGDEAVLTWNYKKGMVNNNCISLYFSFQQKLASKAKFYMDKFGIIPKFKAGVHGGKLIIVEVGSIKKELAYHGDVINTTARIQAKCNTHNSLLLISEELLSKLNSKVTATSIGEISLKGKEEKISILSLLSDK